MQKFKKISNTEYEGTIYNAENGHVYDTKIWLSPDGEKLHIRGYWGIFYGTNIWTRVSN